MEVKGIVWMGVRTQAFAAMVKLLRDVMGLRITDEQANHVWFELPRGGEVQVYGPGDRDHEFFSTAPVVGLLVDDVGRARAEMEAAGIEFIGPIQRAGRSSWNHFRGPDGNVYEIISRR